MSIQMTLSQTPIYIYIFHFYVVCYISKRGTYLELDTALFFFCQGSTCKRW